MNSPAPNSDSEQSEPPPSALLDDIPSHQAITPKELDRLQSSDSSHIILDCRSPIAYQTSHLEGSLNVSVPTLIVKRLNKGMGAKPTWSTLGGFVPDVDGRKRWEELGRDVDVVLLGETGRDDVAKVLRDVVDGLLAPGGSARILRGGWSALSRGEGSNADGVTEHDTPLQSVTLPPLGSGGTIASSILTPEPSVIVAPPTPPTIPAPRLANQMSMPSLRARRAEQGGLINRPPKLSLNVGAAVREPPRSATLGAFDRRPAKSPGLLSIDTTVGRAGPSRSSANRSFPLSARSASFDDAPSIASQHGQPIQSIQLSAPSDEAPHWPLAPSSDCSSAITLTHAPVMDIPNAGPIPGSARPAIAPFIVSTIISRFLYLGPEIVEQQEIDALKRIGVKRILNVAIECEDDPVLRLTEQFDKYLKVPMRDIVEETGLSKGIEDAVAFLGKSHSSGGLIQVTDTKNGLTV